MENKVNIEDIISYLKELRNDEINASEEVKRIKQSKASNDEVIVAENKEYDAHMKFSDALFMVILYVYMLPPEEAAKITNEVLSSLT